MKLSIVVLTPGPSEGKTIPINGEQFTIGRDPGCHLRPASTHVSNHHCAILRREDKVFLRDSGSTNGTFVNDRQIKASEIELHHGDRIRVGQLLLTIRLEREPATLHSYPLASKVAMRNGRSGHAIIPPAQKPACSAGNEEGTAATLLLMQERGVPGTGQPTETPDISTVSDGSFATLPDKENDKPKPASVDPSTAPAAAGSPDENEANKAAQEAAEAKQMAVAKGPGLKLLKFMLGFLVGFGVSALAVSAWFLSLLTLVDWFRGDNWFFSRFPFSLPLWLAVVFVLAIPPLTLLLIVYIKRHRTRSS